MDDLHNPHISKLAASLVQWAGGGALIVEHMVRHEDPDAPEGPFETLARLIREVLAPLAERHSEAGLRVAADILAEAVDTLGEELILVDTPADLPGG